MWLLTSDLSGGQLNQYVYIKADGHDEIQVIAPDVCAYSSRCPAKKGSEFRTKISLPVVGMERLDIVLRFEIKSSEDEVITCLKVAAHVNDDEQGIVGAGSGEM